MTQGKPWQLILRFSFPLLIGNILQQTYNMVDSIVVGNFVGKEALAAVGNSFIIVFLLVSLFMGLGMGATILISQFFGAGRHDRIKAVVDTMYIGMIFGSLLVTLIGVVFARPLLLLMHTPAGQTLEDSVVYLQVIFMGTLPSFGYNMNAGILQGVGDSKSSLRFLILATVLNIVLDLLFVAVFGMGVFGVALATVISQIVAFVYGIWFINKKIQIFTISYKNLNFEWGLLWSSFKIGFPAGIQNVLFSVGTMALQRLVNSFGPGFMAGYGTAGKIDSFAFMPIASFANATTTYVGQNMGARKIERVKQGVRSVLFISVSLCVVTSVLVLVFGEYLLAAFSRDAEVIETGMEFLWHIMPGYFLLAILFVLNSALRGAGETIIPLLSSILSLLIGRVPAAYILNHFFGKHHMFWCYAVGWFMGLILTVPWFLSNKWAKKSII